MTNWLRVLGAYFVDYLAWGILAFGLLLAAAWEGWVLYKRREFRSTETERRVLKHVQDSQRGKRPMWTVDASDVKVYDYELQKKNEPRK